MYMYLVSVYCGDFSFWYNIVLACILWKQVMNVFLTSVVGFAKKKNLLRFFLLFKTIKAVLFRSFEKF